MDKYAKQMKIKEVKETTGNQDNLNSRIYSQAGNAAVILLILVLLVLGGVYLLVQAGKLNLPASVSNQITKLSDNSSTEPLSEEQKQALDSPVANVTVSGSGSSFSFSPETITISPHTTLTIVNQDKSAHMIVFAPNQADPNLPAAQDSSTLNTDDSFSYKFDFVGIYTYYDSSNLNIKGSVVVQ